MNTRKIMRDIEQFRKDNNISRVTMCNTLCMSREQDYMKALKGHYELSPFQLICFIMTYEYTPPSLKF